MEESDHGIDESIDEIIMKMLVNKKGKIKIFWFYWEQYCEFHEIYPLYPKLMNFKIKDGEYANTLDILCNIFNEFPFGEIPDIQSTNVISDQENGFIVSLLRMKSEKDYLEMGKEVNWLYILIKYFKKGDFEDWNNLKKKF